MKRPPGGEHEQNSTKFALILPIHCSFPIVLNKRVVTKYNSYFESVIISRTN